MQFAQATADEIQHFAAFSREPVIFPGASAAGTFCARDPAVLLHAMEQWIKSAGTDFVTVPPQFADDPLAVKRFFSRVMQDMNLPKTEQNFALGCFHKKRVRLYRFSWTKTI